jgi:cytochrome c oxidase assembly factor CtaG
MQLPAAHWAGTFAPLEFAPVAAIAAAYVVRARTLAARGTPVPAWRQACFAGGIALLVVGLASPLDHIGDELLVAHMAQHLIMADLGALLLVLGLTGPLLQPLLANRWLGWLRFLGHPAVALPLWVADLYLWHVPALYQAALAHDPVHALEHACFVGFGIAMWMALLGPLPKPAWFGNGARLIYVVVVRLAGAVLANILIWSGSVIYPDYRGGDAYWNISPLADQGAAGVVMMIEGGLVTLGLFVWLFFRAAREGEERQRLLDLASERGLALDEARAARAVAAGQGGRLEERLRER